MAEDAIDKALAGGRLHAAGPCCTKELPLMGAQGYTSALFTDVAQHYRVPHRPGAIDTRVARYLAGEPGFMSEHSCANCAALPKKGCSHACWFAPGVWSTQSCMMACAHIPTRAAMVYRVMELQPHALLMNRSWPVSKLSSCM